MENVQQDQFVLIRIQGMHCHKCEKRIVDAMKQLDGVREVEVDFASGQASVLFDHERVRIQQLMQAVTDAGYTPEGFTAGTRAEH